MRIATGLTAVFLFAAVDCAAAPAAGAPPLVRRSAIQRIQVENRNNDSVIVVLSRASDRSPFRYASRLKPGATELVEIPNQPWLLARVLTDDAVRRAAGETEARRQGNSDGKRNTGLGLALALAGNRKNDQRRDDDRDDDRDGRHDADHHGDAAQESTQYEQEHEGQDEHRDDDDRSGGSVAGGLLLGHVLRGGGKKNRNEGNGDDDGDGLAGNGGILDADDGSGERELDGVGLTVTAGDADGVEDDDGPMLGGDSSIAISNDPPPVNAKPPTTETPPCFCGPDVTAAYVVALKRAHDRVKALPDSETGPWDGAWFLSRNAGSMDEIARGVPIPGKSNADGEAGANMLCPSGPCGDLPGAGSGTLSICGICLPKHVGNDIMYGFVGYLLGVPNDIQNMGGHYAQIFSAYSSLDPPQSRAAYAIGRNIAALESPLVWGGVFNEENVCKLMSGAAYYTGNEITTPVKRNSAVGFIQETYPALANCPRCPADATQPGTLLRDWTTSVWTLDDGTRVYPPGFDPNAPIDESE